MCIQKENKRNIHTEAIQQTRSDTHTHIHTVRRTYCNRQRIIDRKKRPQSRKNRAELDYALKVTLPNIYRV